MSQFSIIVGEGSFSNTDLRSATHPDLSSARVTQWSTQYFVVEYSQHGILAQLQLTGNFTANGTPVTLGDVSGQAVQVIEFFAAIPTFGYQWGQGFDVRDIATFNYAAERASLDSGLVFRGDPRGYSDDVMGGASNDVFIGNGGWDTFYGGDGLDYVVVKGDPTDYDFRYTLLNDSRADDTNGPNSRLVSGWAVEAKDGSSNKNFDLVGIERLQFDNISLAFDSDGVAGQAYRLYKAAFNRQPDELGLGYWIDQLDKGADLRDVSYGFLNSAEFISMYGSSSSNQDFVEALYLNILQRPGEAAGVQYWEQALDNGYSRENVLLDFSDTVENRNNTEPFTAYGIRYESWDPIIV